jgi:hypothetical protein
LSPDDLFHRSSEYEPEDAHLLARVEDLHRQLGALAEKVSKNRKEGERIFVDFM